jgi:glycosyltransferase involved in cell wall biosynthesis
LPEVSVVIPVYNAEATLGPCLDSVLQQTFSDIEVICINDGSTDRSGAIIDEYAARDPRIRVRHQENIGQHPSRNAALALVRGRYMLSVDCDDVIEPNLVERVYYRAEAEAADITLLGWDYLTGPYKPPDLLTWNLREWAARSRAAGFPLGFGYVWMKLYRKEFLDCHNLRFNEEFYTKADLIFHWKSMSLAERVCVVPEALYHYRVHGNSITGTIGKRFVQVIGVMETIRAELAGIGDPKGLLRLWPCFALAFLHSAYQQTAPQHQPEMRQALQRFVSDLDPAGQRALREPGQLPRHIRYFYLSLESPAAEFRYGTLFRLRGAVMSGIKAVLLPAGLKQRLMEFVKKRSYTLSGSGTSELRATVLDLNDLVNRLAADNHRLRARVTEDGRD